MEKAKELADIGSLSNKVSGYCANLEELARQQGLDIGESTGEEPKSNIPIDDSDENNENKFEIIGEGLDSVSKSIISNAQEILEYATESDLRSMGFDDEAIKKIFASGSKVLKVVGVGLTAVNIWLDTEDGKTLGEAVAKNGTEALATLAAGGTVKAIAVGLGASTAVAGGLAVGAVVITCAGFIWAYDNTVVEDAVDLIGGYIDDLFDRSTPEKMAEALEGYDPNVYSGHTIAPYE